MGQGKKFSLTFQIVLAMTLGLIVGMLLQPFSGHEFVDEWLVGGLFYVIGKVFIASLKMLVVPLVFVSLVCGVCGLDDVQKLGRLGGKVFLLYVSTTAIAISAAIFFAVSFQPGQGFNLPSELDFKANPSPPLKEIIINIVPSNPFQAAVEGNMLQIIVFAILFGLGVSLLGKQSEKIQTLFFEINQVIMKIVTLLMKLAPYGVFALIAKLFAKQGLSAITPLISYFLVVLGVLCFHLFVVYGSLLKILTGLSPLKFFSKIRPTMMFAFSTASSNATLPVTIKAVTERLGVKKSIAAFTIPLGATINMDGTAIMQGVATAFIAQAYNISIGLNEYLMVVVTATLASIGTAGVPGVGMITLAMVLRQVGLPVEGIALIIGVDRLLDMIRTAVNVGGDAIVACIVAKSEKSMDQEVYESQAELEGA